MAPKQKKKPMSDERYDVDVWDHEGNVVRHLRDATYEEAEELREEYADDPFHAVVIEERD